VTAKRFANIRSDFLAAVKVSGLAPVKCAGKAALTPAWGRFFQQLSGRRVQIGLSRLASDASSQGIKPQDINDQSLHRRLHLDPERLQDLQMGRPKK
jgi:hypothetical protein